MPSKVQFCSTWPLFHPAKPSLKLLLLRARSWHNAFHCRMLQDGGVAQAVRGLEDLKIPLLEL